MRRLLLATVLALAMPAVLGMAGASAAPTGSYIVVLNDSVKAPGAIASQQAARLDGKVGYVYSHALKGYSATLTAAAVKALEADPRVAYVAPNQTAHTFVQAIPTGIERIGATDNPNLDIDGADDVRIDVDVAVVDTGVDFTNPELNVVARTNCVNRTFCLDNSGTDDNGHGSHVAGTVGAIDNGDGVVGVAPGARLWAVKVLDGAGSGSFAGIIAGIDWVTDRANQIEVINMSLGCTGFGCENQALDDAIEAAVDAGVVVVVAAGNDGANAANTVPANHPDVVTVSAIADFDGQPGGNGAPTCRFDQDDTLVSFSNFGGVVEIAAPGTCILSTSNNGGLATLSGTSMATPHVAGAAGILASGANDPQGRGDVLAIRSTLINTGNFNWTDDSFDGIKEPLLDVSDPNQYPPGGGGGENQPPTARFTDDCNDTTLACAFDGSGSSDPDGTVVDWDWDFGDGTSGSGQTVNHTYSSPGTFTVRLTVTDDEGATDTASRTIQVGDGGGGDVIFADDFEVSRGWVRNPDGTDGATAGVWDRGDPDGTSFAGTDFQLDTTTSGTNDLVTGASHFSVGSNDVDGGDTTALSPAIQLPSSGNITLTFNWYLAHYSNSSFSDFLHVFVDSGGSSTNVLDAHGTASIRSGEWAGATVDLSGFAGQTIRIRVVAADNGQASLVEAGIDDVEVSSD